MLDRRSVLRGLFAAPAIVVYKNIMPVKLFTPIGWEFDTSNLLVEAHECYNYGWTDLRVNALLESMCLTREKMAADFFNDYSTYKSQWDRLLARS